MNSWLQFFAGAHARRVYSSCLCFVFCLVAIGCKSDKIKAQIKTLEQRKQEIVNEVHSRQEHISGLNDRLDKLTQGMNDYKSSVIEYMGNHKMAIAAIVFGYGGVKMGLSDSDAFSADMKKLGWLVGGAAALYALANADEVSEVITTMQTANDNAAKYKAAIAASQSSIAEEQGYIQGDQADLAQLEQQIANLQSELRSSWL
jgi:septal ring factor EnvC (AmiA/AmiB activator)